MKDETDNFKRLATYLFNMFNWEKVTGEFKTLVANRVA